MIICHLEDPLVLEKKNAALPLANCWPWRLLSNTLNKNAIITYYVHFKISFWVVQQKGIHSTIWRLNPDSVTAIHVWKSMKVKFVFWVGGIISHLLSSTVNHINTRRLSIFVFFLLSMLCCTTAPNNV